MPDSNILVYVFGELALLLLLISGFLMLYAGKLRKLIVALEEKIVSLRAELSKSRKAASDALKKLAAKEKIKPKEFLDYLDDEIDATRDHHQTLNPDRDIVLDIATDAPLDRQAASLRHACLIAEKEARYAGGEKASSWEVLQSKFEQIIQFYASAQPATEAEVEDVEEEALAEEADTEEQADTSAQDSDASGLDASDLDDNDKEIANYKKRIENLERFKKLFFEMESKWSDSKKQADDYQQQLLAMSKDLGGGDDFDALLNNYSATFDDIGELIAAAGEGSATGSSSGEQGDTELAGKSENIGKTVIANQDEMQRLRNMAVDQHKVISELKRKLIDAKSVEQQQEVIAELTAELEQQQRFIKETETCTQLIEDELTRTIQENEELREQVAGADKGGLDDGEMEKLESVVNDLTTESKEMLGVIASLEGENAALKQQLDSGVTATGAVDGEDVEALKEKLGGVQQELLNLQTQHIELEERYLELKMQ